MRRPRLLLLAILLAACREAPAREPVELRVWAFGREGEEVARLVPAFERAHPGVRVRVQQIPWTAAHEKLLTAYVGDATPDVAQLGNTWIPEFVALGAIEPLDPWLRRSAVVDSADFFAGIWATNVLDDGTYGVPWYVDTRVLFYRADLLREAGYDAMPVTWAEWREAMEAMRARMGARQWPLLLPTNEWAQPVILGLQRGATLLREDGRWGAFRDPRFREAFDFYVGLFRDGLAPAVSANEIANRYQEFARGNVAMMITGPWELGEFARRIPPDMQDRWATAPLPGPDGPGVSMAGGSSLVLFRASRHKPEAWALVEFLSQPAQQLAFWRLTGNLPAHRAAWEDPALAGDARVRAFRAQLERVVPLPQVPEWEQIATRVFEWGERAVRGGVSVDRALAGLDAEVDELLAKRRFLLAREEARAPEGRE